MIIVKCQQGSPEWHQARAGVITASMFAECRKRLKTGEPSAASKAYAFRLAVERISKRPLDEADIFETFAMRRGRELEPEAREAHEFARSVQVDPCGFVMTDDGHFGASADGLIGSDGGSEYKCLIDPTRIRDVILSRDISDFQDQVQGCMWLTGRAWWHFVLYVPALACIGRALTVFEVARDEEYIEAMVSDLLRFDALVSDYEQQLRAAA